MRINDLGIDLNVQIKGKGETVVWAHGLTSSMASEDLLDVYDWEELSKKNHLVRYDARGHGLSEPTYAPTDYHWRSLANDMLAIADELQIDKFIAGGQSMGSATTLYAGMIAPQRIKAMILMNPPTAWETRSKQGQFYNRLAKIGGLLGGNILSKVVGRKPERLLPEWLVEAKKENIRGGLEGLKSIKRKTLSAIFKGAALTDLPSETDLKTINIPTLILAWEGDQSHPIKTAIKLDQLLPKSNIYIAKEFSDLEIWPGLIRDFISQIK